MSRSKKGKGGRPPGRAVDGTRIRQLRKEAGHSQVDLALIAGVARRTIQNAEKGKSLGRDSLRRLADGLDVPVEDLLVGAAESRSAFRPPPTRGVAEMPPSVRKALMGLLAKGTGVICVGGASNQVNRDTAASMARALQRELRQDILWISATRALKPGGAGELQREIAVELGFGDRLPEPGRVTASQFDAAFTTELWREARIVVVDGCNAQRITHYFLPAQLQRGVAIVTTSTRMVAQHFDPHCVERMVTPGKVDSSTWSEDARRAFEVLLDSNAAPIPDARSETLARDAGMTLERWHSALSELVDSFVVVEVRGTGGLGWQLAFE